MKWYDEINGLSALTYAILEDDAIWIPIQYEVCPCCRGQGTTVNPSIDGNGLSAEDFAEDPDFREDYFRGRYDVSCCECGGRGLIPWPEKPEHVEAVEEWIRDGALIDAEYAAERRMGA